MFISSSLATLPGRLRVESTWLSRGAVRIAVAGEIDLATVDELRAGLLGAIHAGSPRCLEIDMSEVTFIDCGGLSVLIVAKHSASRIGCRLWIVDPQPAVRRVLELTGLLDFLTEPAATPGSRRAA